MSVEEINNKILTLEQFYDLLKLAKVARGYHNKCQKHINNINLKFGDKIADIFTDVICDDKPTNESLQEKLQFFGISVEGEIRKCQ